MVLTLGVVLFISGEHVQCKDSCPLHPCWSHRWAGTTTMRDPEILMHSAAQGGQASTQTDTLQETPLLTPVPPSLPPAQLLGGAPLPGHCLGWRRPCRLHVVPEPRVASAALCWTHRHRQLQVGGSGSCMTSFLVVFKFLLHSGSDNNNLPAMWETCVQSLGWQDPLEKEIATHSSILAWSQTQLSNCM